MIDTHAHLTDERLAGQIDAVLARAKEAGVDEILVPTTGLLDGKKATELCERYENLWALVGIHPEVLADETDPNYREEWLAAGGEWINRLEKLAGSSKKVVGIGEIGLDFYYDREKRSQELQMRIFQEQMELAVKTNLPVAIHMRAAETEMNEVLTQMTKLPKGQFHCFAGSDELLKLVIAKGFYISFCGNITYKSAGLLREQVKRVPFDRLLLETDSPYLAPEERPTDSGAVRAGGRGSLNEPANVKIIAEYIAKLCDVPFETLINQTTANAQCLYFGG